MKNSSNALDIVRRRVGPDASFWGAVQLARAQSEIACRIQWAREKAGMTQAQLAKRLGTTQSAISRLEDPDSRFVPSLATVVRAAQALDLVLEVKLRRRSKPRRPNT